MALVTGSTVLMFETTCSTWLTATVAIAGAAAMANEAEAAEYEPEAAANEPEAAANDPEAAANDILSFGF